jgi:hypothetical protein
MAWVGQGTPVTNRLLEDWESLLWEGEIDRDQVKKAHGGNINFAG